MTMLTSLTTVTLVSPSGDDRMILVVRANGVEAFTFSDGIKTSHGVAAGATLEAAVDAAYAKGWRMA